MPRTLTPPQRAAAASAVFARDNADSLIDAARRARHAAAIQPIAPVRVGDFWVRCEYQRAVTAAALDADAAAIEAANSARDAARYPETAVTAAANARAAENAVNAAARDVRYADAAQSSGRRGPAVGGAIRLPNYFRKIAR